MDKQVHVAITVGTVIKILIIGALAWAVWKLHATVLLVVTAVVIASAIEPGVTFFKRYRVPRILAVLIMYLAVFGTIFAILYFFFPPILADAQGLLATAPKYLETLNLPGSVTGSTPLSGLTGGENQLQGILGTLVSFQSAFSDTSQGVIRVITTFFGGIFSLVLVIVLSFYFAIQETGVEDFLRLVSPSKNEVYIVDLWLRARVKIGLWMQGQLLSSVIGGTLVFLGLSLGHVPYALILAVFTAFAGIVPIFGAFVAAVPAIIIAYSAHGVPSALFVTGLFVIISQFEAHLIHPLVVNKVVGIPPLLVILALIVGGELGGFLGVLLAIPLAAVLREFLNDYAKGKRAAKELAKS